MSYILLFLLKFFIYFARICRPLEAFKFTPILRALFTREIGPSNQNPQRWPSKEEKEWKKKKKKIAARDPIMRCFVRPRHYYLWRGVLLSSFLSSSRSFRCAFRVYCIIRRSSLSVSKVLLPFFLPFIKDTFIVHLSFLPGSAAALPSLINRPGNRGGIILIAQRYTAATS